MRPSSMVLLAALLAPALAEGQNLRSDVTEAVIEMCRGGTLEGRSYTLRAEGEASGGVVLIKRLLEAGLEGQVSLNEEEWRGIRALTPEQWDQRAYTDCVEGALDRLLPLYEQANRRETGEVKVRNRGSAAICASGARITPIVFKAGPRAAKPEALLRGEGLPDGEVRLRTGETAHTVGGCAVTLAATGYDIDFYAVVSYRDD